MLVKHAKSENCAGMTVTKVNPEIWTQLNNFKRKADLRLSNVQQSLQKASFGVLKSCDFLVSDTPTGVDKTGILQPSVDAIALTGYACR